MYSVPEAWKLIKKELRTRAVAKEIQNNPSYSVSVLARQFNVSEMTIRRDIKYIEENNLLDLFQPSVVREGAGVSCAGYEFYREAEKMADEKLRIARYAVSLIKPNDVLMMDTGTTVDLVASFLPMDLPLTVICYNYNVLSHLYDRDNIRLMLAGGYYHRISESFESSENVSFLQNVRATKMFVSTSGVEKLGLTCTSQYEVITKQTAIHSSLKRILLADSSKFGVIKSGFFADLKDMDLIITDEGLSQDWQNYIQEMNIALKIV